MHGRQNTNVFLNVSLVSSEGLILFQIENDAGPNHAQGLALQQNIAMQPNGTLCSGVFSQAAARHGMGSRESTFRGMNEVEQAIAGLNRGSCSLTFKKTTVQFTLKFAYEKRESK